MGKMRSTIKNDFLIAFLSVAPFQKFRNKKLKFCPFLTIVRSKWEREIRVNISSFQPSLSSLVLAPINCTKICFFCPKKQTNLPSWGQLQKWLLACYSKNRNKSFDWFSTHSTTYPLLNVLTKVMVVTLYSSVRDNLFLIVSISHVTLWLAPW